VNHKESEIDMPEPHAEPNPNFSIPGDASGRDFPGRLADACLASGIDPEGRHGRVIRIDSDTLRKKIRRFASARTAVTDADLLFVGLAFVPADPAATIPTDSERLNRLHHARLERTLADPEQALSRATVQAARLLAVVEQAVRSMGGTAEWILEGLDRPAIEALLAVPNDHRIVGMIAGFGVKWPTDEVSRSIPAATAPIDLDGFGGGFSAVRPHTGGGSGGGL